MFLLSLIKTKTINSSPYHLINLEGQPSMAAVRTSLSNFEKMIIQKNKRNPAAGHFYSFITEAERYFEFITETNDKKPVQLIVNL